MTAEEVFALSDDEYEGRRKALDEVFVQFINRDNDDSFYEFLLENLLEPKEELFEQTWGAK